MKWTGLKAALAFAVVVLVSVIALTIFLIFLLSWIWPSDPDAVASNLGPRGFWGQNTNLAALIVGVFAALIGALGATIGTYFVARKTAQEITRIGWSQSEESRLKAEAFTDGQRSQGEAFQREQGERDLYSRYLEEAAKQMTRLGLLIQEDHFSILRMTSDAKADRDALKSAASHQMESQAVFGLCASFLPPGEVRDMAHRAAVEAQSDYDRIIYPSEVNDEVAVPLLRDALASSERARARVMRWGAYLVELSVGVRAVGVTACLTSVSPERASELNPPFTL